MRLENSHPAWAETWPAPAKLNLFLHIVGRRADGYHLLETVFQLLEHGDWLRFSPRDDNRIVREGGLASIEDDDDLVIKAAKRLFAVAGCEQGVTIAVCKQLPAGGGLGGGSSDAATVLVVLNQLFQLKLSVDELAALGLELGADVPLFVRGCSAWAQGVGEDLQPIELPQQWFLVATPDVAIGTADIFSAPELSRNTPLRNADSLEFEAGVLLGHNDCQPVAETRFPDVSALVRLMSQQAPTRMTGTGSSVFSLHASKAEAENLATKLPDSVSSFVCLGVNKSALQNKLEKLFSSK